MSDNESPDGLVDKVDERVSTDIITDLKVGVYNLFINLVNNMMVTLGPEGAIREGINFLQEIIINFEESIKPQE